MIYINTTAYNASKTLRRAVESILNQTYGEFRYYLVDNGSTDDGKTKRIVEEYAKSDNRIVAFFNEKNHIWDKNKEVHLLPHTIGDEDYYCILDADDEYDLSFFEKMLGFMNENNLDIGVCGSDYINADNNDFLIGTRCLKNNLILEGNSFHSSFSGYYKFMRTIWGKLFKGKTLRNTILDLTSPKLPLVYGNDTFFTIYAFHDAKRVGILAESLHKYYISQKTISYVFNENRIKCDRILNEAAFDYLKSYGKISEQNREFLLIVFLNACMDTFHVIVQSKLSIYDKLRYIWQMLDYDTINQIRSCTNREVLKVYCMFRAMIKDWILKYNEYDTTSCGELAVNILMFLYYEKEIKNINHDCFVALIRQMPEVADNIIKEDYKGALRCLQKNYDNINTDDLLLSEMGYNLYCKAKAEDSEFLNFYIKLFRNCPLAFQKLKIEEKIKKLMSKYFVLNNASLEFINIFLPAVLCFMNKDYVNAKREFFKISGIELDDEDVKTFYKFGQVVSAATEDVDNYIYYSKSWITYLIDYARVEEAKKELTEFEQLLPDDSEIQEMRNKISYL